MAATLEKVFGYKGDNMNLPVPTVDEAVRYYESVLGFHVVSRADVPERAAVLARDSVRMRIVENGGDPAQDGCAFHVNGLEELLAEFATNGLATQASDVGVEHRDGVPWKVFYVVAPDGLCYWFGERAGPTDTS